jgi:murein DD-endopeptidase MepM/ murein hydrolase activator NlpD
MMSRRALRFSLALTLVALTQSVFAKGIDIDGQTLQGSLLRGKAAPGAKVLLNDKPLAVSSDGDFVLGFSRDEETPQTLVVEFEGERSQLTLNPTKREYRIQRIDGLDQNKVTPPASVLDRIRSDAALVRKARGGVSTLEGFKQDFIWPSEGVITGVYGSQRVLNGKPSRPHYGIDLAAPTGTLVVAPAAGKITMAHPDLYYSGGTLIIDHGLGVFSTFLHMDSMSVSVGDMVEQGDKIGEIGETGRATGPHLDWRINWGQVRLDPALLVSPKEGLDYVKSAD